jgi:hypothetical protein
MVRPTQNHAHREGFASARVAVVSQPHQGSRRGEERRVLDLSGDYVQWLDADDLLASDKIRLQVDALRGSPSRTLLSCEWGTSSTDRSGPPSSDGPLV